MLLGFDHSIDIHTGSPSLPPQIRPVVDERFEVSMGVRLYRSDEVSIHESLSGNIEQKDDIEKQTIYIYVPKICSTYRCKYACMYVRYTK